MSCRHDLASGTCLECFPESGHIRPSGPGDSMDAPGAAPRAPSAPGDLTARYVGDVLDLVLGSSDDSLRAVAGALRARAAAEPDHLKRLATYHLVRFVDDVLERRELRRRLSPGVGLR